MKTLELTQENNAKVKALKKISGTKSEMIISIFFSFLL
jgi:hypothetical protein